MKPISKILAASCAALFLSSAPVFAQTYVAPGWFVAGSKPANYNFGTEKVAGSAGNQSAFIKAKPGAAADGFGTVMQTISASNYVGQRIRLSARLKSQDATSLNLWLRIDGPKNATTGYPTSLGFYNMQDKPVTGTSDWKRYDIVLDVPDNSVTLNYGFFLSGSKGAGWADSFTVERVGKDVPVSSLPPAPLAAGLVNGSFDK